MVATQPTFQMIGCTDFQWYDGLKQPTMAMFQMYLWQLQCIWVIQHHSGIARVWQSVAVATQT